MKKPILSHPRYVRKGKCLRCGFCCLSENCEHFEWIEKDGKKIANCKIFGKPERPEKCVNFPQAPPLLNPKCGYYFLDTWENNRKVKMGGDL